MSAGAPELGVSSDALEQRVNWLRSLAPAEVFARCAAALGSGTSEDELWAAAVLVAARHISSEAHNLLGFVSHSIIGCGHARRLAAGRPQRERWLVLLMALHQVVLDLHDPSLTPFALPPRRAVHAAGAAASFAELRADVRIGERIRADQRLVGLASCMAPHELAACILEIGLEGALTEEHTILFAFETLALCQLVGWELGLDLLRVCVRYVASFPRSFAPYDRAVALRARHALTAGPPLRGLEVQAERVALLATTLGAGKPEERPELAADAMAKGGCTAATVVEAAALVGCEQYLMTRPVASRLEYELISREVAPLHLGTGLHAIRRALPTMQPGQQALAAIIAGALIERGPMQLGEGLIYERFAPARPYPFAEDVGELRSNDAASLLARLGTALGSHDPRGATAAVRAYADLGAATGPLLQALFESACAAQGILLHNQKYFEAMAAGFTASPPPARWNYLIAAARYAAWYSGLATQSYEQAVFALAQRSAQDSP